MTTLYSIGYHAVTLNDVKALAKSGVLIVDTRIRPVSRNPSWNKSNLEKVLGEKYTHAEGFGNLNYKGGPIELKAPSRELPRLIGRIKAGYQCAFMCMCPDVNKCHRRVVLDLIRSALAVSKIEPQIIELAEMVKRPQATLFEGTGA